MLRARARARTFSLSLSLSRINPVPLFPMNSRVYTAVKTRDRTVFCINDHSYQSVSITENTNTKDLVSGADVTPCEDLTIIYYDKIHRVT